MGAPVPRMHGVTHVPGGPDPIPNWPTGGGGGGGTPVSSLILTEAEGWSRAVPSSSSPTPIQWMLYDDPPADFSTYWEFRDASFAVTAGPEFVYLGVKKFGVISASGYIRCPSGPPSADYFRRTDINIEGSQVASWEEWDYRVLRMGFSAAGAPLRIGFSPPNSFGVTFRQTSGSSMTLAGAWCHVAFWEGTAP